MLLRLSTRVSPGSLLGPAARARYARILLILFSLTLHTQVYNLVVRGGRVIGSESGLDAIRNIGITAGEIRAFSERPLSGRTLDASMP
jgi:hypothetical protein